MRIPVIANSGPIVLVVEEGNLQVSQVALPRFYGTRFTEFIPTWGQLMAGDKDIWAQLGVLGYGQRDFTHVVAEADWRCRPR